MFNIQPVPDLSQSLRFRSRSREQTSDLKKIELKFFSSCLVMDRPIMQLDWQPLCSFANCKQSQTFDALVNRSAIISLITISRLENELKINFPSKLGRKQWRLFSSQNLIDCQLSSAKVFVTCHTTNGKYMFKFEM